MAISQAFIIPIFYEKLGINFYIVVVFIALPITIGIATFITNKIEKPYSKLIKEKLQTLTFKFFKLKN